jgi:hypothetical protein
VAFCDGRRKRNSKFVIYQHYCQTDININTCEGHILPSVIHTNFTPDYC